MRERARCAAFRALARLRAGLLGAVLLPALAGCLTLGDDAWTFGITRHLYGAIDRQIVNPPAREPANPLRPLHPGVTGDLRDVEYGEHGYYAEHDAGGIRGVGGPAVLLMVGAFISLPVLFDVVLLPVELTHDALYARR